METNESNESNPSSSKAKRNEKKRIGFAPKG
jgi:hypothetical protein